MQIRLDLLAALSLFDSRVQLAHFTSPDLDFKPEAPDLERAQNAVDQCGRVGAEVLHPGHEWYPVEFLQLETPPLFLSLLGSAPWKSRPCFSVVGSREMSPEVGGWLDLHFSKFLEKIDDICVVSGGARGADQAAHRAAILTRRPTLAFLPSGLFAPYPKEIMKWRDRILEGGGGFISPYAPDQEIRRHHFEGRNRLIAALSRWLFIVQARRRSGSVMTARLANELGRELAALPFFPNSSSGSGTLDLLANGATLIRDTDDLLAFYYGKAHAPDSTPRASDDKDRDEREE